MVRPVVRGRDAGAWSLVQVAAEAGVTRGVARAAVARGLLPDGPLVEGDIVLLRVAAVLLASPDPRVPVPAKHSPGAGRPGRRDADALRYARAILGDPRAQTGAAVLVAASQVAAVDRGEEVLEALRSMPGEAVTVLPVGMWRALLPSHRSRRSVPGVAADVRDPGAGRARAAERSPERVLQVPGPGVEGAGRVSSHGQDGRWAQQLDLDPDDPRPLVPGEPW